MPVLTEAHCFVPKISGNDESTRKIVIEFNVTIKDNPQLANATKHWVGAGMRSGYQMLWVGQEALYVYKVRSTALEAKAFSLKRWSLRF